jgi:hypothetical protein
MDIKTPLREGYNMAKYGANEMTKELTEKK